MENGNGTPMYMPVAPAGYGGSYEGGSNARGRSRTTGRYISRDNRDYDPYRDPEGYRR